MGTTDNVMRRRGGVARSDDRRLAELTRALFAGAYAAPQQDAKNRGGTRARKKPPARGSVTTDDD